VEDLPDRPCGLLPDPGDLRKRLRLCPNQVRDRAEVSKKDAGVFESDTRQGGYHILLLIPEGSVRFIGMEFGG
jgi:hypothetical protein